VPFYRNYVKNERLWPRLAGRLRDIARADKADILHAQHTLTVPAAVEAGKGLDVPVVCTVRDYWPVCYWSTLIHDPRSPTLCPACTPGMMTRCLRPRAGAAWPVALPVIPYMRANLRRKQQALAGAAAIIAVSSVMAADLRARSAALSSVRIEVIPNPVDVAGLRRGAVTSWRPMAGPYAVFVGKLEVNKGADALVAAVERARLPWPLVVVGDGARRAALEAAAQAAGRDVRVAGWQPRDTALAWLSGASVLVFPSYGPESLSRVLLEAAALGVPIAAMDTGGTGDIVRHEVTGLLSATPEALGDDVARLVADRPLAARLAAAARAHVEAHFDAPSVVARIEALYTELRANRGGHV
jgi:glycosyltransferase involved in cell wall biosynthesis